MSQPPQGQYPYQQPYGQPQQPYPGAPGQPPYQGAPGQPPYGYQSQYQAAPAKPKRGKGLGIAAFALVLIGGAVAAWGSWMAGHAFSDLVLSLNIPMEQWDTIDPSMIPDSDLSALGITFMPALVAALIGIVGWIACIVATVIGSARPVAIIGIVLGVLAPVAAYIAFSAAIVAKLGGGI